LTRLKLGDRKHGDICDEWTAYVLVDFRQFIPDGFFSGEVNSGQLSAFYRMKPFREPIKYPANNFVDKLFRILVGTINSTNGEAHGHCSTCEASENLPLPGNSCAESGGQSLRIKAIQV